MSRLLFGVLAAAVLLPVALADDDHPDPFDPPNDQLDQELDDSLRREYDENGNLISPPPPPVDPDQDPPSSEGKEDDRLRLKLGGMAAYYYTQLKDVQISHREGTLGGLDIDFDDQGVADFDEEHSLTYRGWFDIGKFVAFQGGFRTTEFSAIGRPQNTFTYGSTTFSANQLLETEIELLTADLDVVVKPLNNRWVELGISFGARYVYWETRFSTPTNVATQERETTEALLPMVGMSLAFRPARPIEIFARGRIGHFEFEREENFRRRNNGNLEFEEARNKEATSAEFEVGLRIMIADTIGIMGGYRVDFIHIQNDRASRAEEVEGTAHGLYAGLVLQF